MTINLYHGSRAWSGTPEVRGAKKGRVEYGPGLYLTTSYETARKYSKGGGSVLRIGLDPAIVWLESARMPLVGALELVRSLRGAKTRLERVSHDLAAAAERMKDRLGGDVVPVPSLVNLLVNLDLVSGANGPVVAAALVKLGIEASLVNAKHDEDWVVLFDPRKIVSVDVVKPFDVGAGKAYPWDWPLLRRP
jgi:hypothetical protein